MTFLQKQLFMESKNHRGNSTSNSYRRERQNLKQDGNTKIQLRCFVVLQLNAP